MSAAAIAAWVTGGASVGAAAVAGVLARKPSRSIALEEMQTALEYQGKMLDRAHERIEALEDDVVECHRQRDGDRRRFEGEIAELRRTVRHLTDKRSPE